MDTPSAIKSDLLRLQRARDDLDRQVIELQTALAVLQRYSRAADPQVAASPASAPSFLGDKSPSGSGPAKPRDVAIAAKAEMAVGQWFTLPHLKEALTAKGIRIGGSDPVGNLSTILSRHKIELGLAVNKKLGWSVLAAVTPNHGAGVDAPQGGVESR